MIRERIQDAVATHPLLQHPFYRRWQRGEVGADELRAYAEQYRHVEAALPGWLRAVRDRTASPAVREAVERNLADEVGNPVPHLELFDRFADALGADTTAAATPATQRLIDLHDDLSRSDATAALAALAYYEIQAAAVSVSKAEGLRDHLGLGGDALGFWEVHGALESVHADWSVEALERLGAESAAVADAAGRAGAAWWAFLDEREAARSA